MPRILPQDLFTTARSETRCAVPQALQRARTTVPRAVAWTEARSAGQPLAIATVLSAMVTTSLVKVAAGLDSSGGPSTA